MFLGLGSIQVAYPVSNDEGEEGLSALRQYPELEVSSVTIISEILALKVGPANFATHPASHRTAR